MAISVTCKQCGKTLRVKDEWAGKRAKCPGCGTPFVVPAPRAEYEPEEEVITPAAYSSAPVAAPAASAKSSKSPKPAKGTAFNPNAAAAARDARDTGTGRVSVNWGLIMLGVGVLAVLALIGAFLTGPKKVWGEWEQMHEEAKYLVIDVVTRGLESHMSQEGTYNPRKPHGRPRADDVMFYRPGFVMSMPDDVEFRGDSTVGPFEGVFHPGTGEVKATVEVGGGSFVPGTGRTVKSGYTINVTGRRQNEKLSVEVNGKDAKLFYPPEDEEG